MLEGLSELLDVGGTHRAGTVLAYAMATWVLPALPFALLGGLLALVVGDGKRAGVAAGLCVGGLFATAAWVDGRGPWLALGLGVLCGGGAGFALDKLLAVRPARWLFGVWVLLLMVWAGGVRMFTPDESFGSNNNRTPVVMIVADALRADALSAYGGETPTPRLDALGEQGWLVADTLSTSSWTLPAVTSLFTAVEPALHGVRTEAGVLSFETPVLAEHLEDHGYRTAAVLSNPIIDPARGFTRGFQVVRADTHAAEASLFWVGRFNKLARAQGWLTGPNASRKLVVPAWDGTARRTGYSLGEDVTDAALELVDELGQRGFLLYVHYFDPHDPYLPHPVPLLWDEPATIPENLEQLRADYAGEVAYMDAQIGRLLDGLEERGVLDEALVVFTADHGEEFLDHGEWRHHGSLHEELVRLPFMVRFPAGMDVPPAPTEASLVDVTPTLLATLGLPPMPSARGRDLRGATDSVARFADRLWLTAVRLDGRMTLTRLPEGLDPHPLQAVRWLEHLDAPPPSLVGGPADWVIPPRLGEAVRRLPLGGQEALVLDPPGDDVLSVRSAPVEVPQGGWLGAEVQLLDGPPSGGLSIFLERKEGDEWVTVLESRSSATSSLASVRLSPVEVQAGTTVRLGVATQASTAPDERWVLGDVRLAVDDPHLLFDAEVYEVPVLPGRADRLPDAPDWASSLRMILEHIASGQESTERALDEDELDRLRAMGYLK